MSFSLLTMQGCRSKLIEHKILEKDPNKRIILLINKIDLVPKNVAMTVASTFLSHPVALSAPSGVPHHPVQGLHAVAALSPGSQRHGHPQRQQQCDGEQCVSWSRQSAAAAEELLPQQRHEDLDHGGHHRVSKRGQVIADQLAETITCSGCLGNRGIHTDYSSRERERFKSRKSKSIATSRCWTVLASFLTATTPRISCETVWMCMFTRIRMMTNRSSKTQKALWRRWCNHCRITRSISSLSIRFLHLVMVGGWWLWWCSSWAASVCCTRSWETEKGRRSWYARISLCDH